MSAYYIALQQVHKDFSHLNSHSEAPTYNNSQEQQNMLFIMAHADFAHVRHIWWAELLVGTQYSTAVMSMKEAHCFLLT